jgi:hypothetical protein
MTNRAKMVELLGLAVDDEPGGPVPKEEAWANAAEALGGEENLRQMCAAAKRFLMQIETLWLALAGVVDEQRPEVANAVVTLVALDRLSKYSRGRRRSFATRLVGRVFDVLDKMNGAGTSSRVLKAIERERQFRSELARKLSDEGAE